MVKDHDYRDQGYHNVTSKNLTVRWTPGHRDIQNATTYRGYLDISGNNDCDVLANMGDNLPMDLIPNRMTPYCTDKSCPHQQSLGSCNFVVKNKRQTYTW